MFITMLNESDYHVDQWRMLREGGGVMLMLGEGGQDICKKYLCDTTLNNAHFMQYFVLLCT